MSTRPPSSLFPPDYCVWNGEVRRGHTLPAEKHTIDLYLVQKHDDPIVSNRIMGVLPTSSTTLDGPFDMRDQSIPMLEHLRKSTSPVPILTLVDDLTEARREQAYHQRIIERDSRRMRQKGGWPFPDVLIHHIQFTRDTQAYFFSRKEMLELMAGYREEIREQSQQEAQQLSRENQWYVWGGIPAEACVAILPPNRRINILKRLEGKLEDLSLSKPAKSSWNVLHPPKTGHRDQLSPGRTIGIERTNAGQASSRCICQPPMRCLCYEMTEGHGESNESGEVGSSRINMG